MKHDPSRVGDLAEHYAITWLWDNGYHVFKNCGCTGPVDIVAMSPEGEITLNEDLATERAESAKQALHLRYV